MCNESKVFLTMLAHVTLHDFTAALVLSSQLLNSKYSSVYLALCLLSCHASQQMPPEHFSSDPKPLYVVICNVITVHTKFSACIEI